MPPRLNIFISHHHGDSAIADALSHTIDTLFTKRVSVSYSTKRESGGSIPTGANWVQWIGEQVNGSPVTILLLTPHFVSNPAWLLWEAGAVYGNALAAPTGKPRVRPLRYGVEPAALPKPLGDVAVQTRRGDDAAEMRQFFRELITDFDVLSQEELLNAGGRLDTLVADYLTVVTPLSARRIGEAAGPPANPVALERTLDLAITAMRTFFPSVRMNGRYFYADVEAGRQMLVRDENVYVETEAMPEEFGLSRLDVERNADTVVICQSYLGRTPLYRVLGRELMAQYHDDIRPHISPVQGWVLACPVLRGDARPSGVICLYGKKPPARTAEDERRLLKVAVGLSDVFARVLTTGVEPPAR